MDERTPQINLDVELTLQDLRHILHTALRIGNLVDHVLERVLPGSVLLAVLLGYLDSDFHFAAVCVAFVAMWLVLARELIVRTQRSELARRGDLRVALSASDDWVEIEQGEPGIEIDKKKIAGPLLMLIGFIVATTLDIDPWQWLDTLVREAKTLIGLNP